MEVEKYINEMKEFHSNLLDFLEPDSKTDFTVLYNFLKVIKSREDLYEILLLILIIGNNYHRNSDFFNKIQQIISSLSSEIKQNFRNDEIADLFKGRLLLENVEIPDSVTTIESRAFLWCHSLEKMSFPVSVTTISSNVFNDCPSLTAVKLYPLVDLIDYKAFADCRSPEHVSFESDSEISNSSPLPFFKINKYAFDNCVALKQINLLPTKN